MSDLRNGPAIRDELVRLGLAALDLSDVACSREARETYEHHLRERMAQVASPLAMERELDVDAALEAGVRAGLTAALRRVRRLEGERVEVWRAATKDCADKIDAMTTTESVRAIAALAKGWR